MCKLEGLCSAPEDPEESDEESCVAGPGDCKRSLVCKRDGRCAAVAGECMATSDAACKASEGCRLMGRCKLEDEECTSPD